jgi:hypothetical protein
MLLGAAALEHALVHGEQHTTEPVQIKDKKIQQCVTLIRAHRCLPDCQLPGQGKKADAAKGRVLTKSNYHLVGYLPP